ncbi:uncharacterized protein EAF01_005288 [Botrytis porri]|uniref:uncharacterized protein n=1 Tax=Botrytis porri TaxID=87229 RepID=UPI0019009E3F|nr:uncharacterized protein EAF01_005288 [Botrytis porri]KAF7907702.1 hypothetical protein EAF01_005288 [Botrytis porri]
MSVASADRIQRRSAQRGLSRMSIEILRFRKATSDRKREISLPFGSTILWYSTSYTRDIGPKGEKQLAHPSIVESISRKSGH